MGYFPSPVRSIPREQDCQGTPHRWRADLRAAQIAPPCIALIRHHHERMDGSGYPDGLHGEQIPLTVRALQIVDICDALTSDRSYRRNLSLPHALIILYEEARSRLAGWRLVSQFASLVSGRRVR